MEKSAEEKVKDAFLDGASESELLEIQQQKDMFQILIFLKAKSQNYNLKRII